MPESCHEFYFNNNNIKTHYDGSVLPGITKALHDALLVVNSNTFNDLDQCVQVVGLFLCRYYFPLCRSRRDEIIPVCSSTYNILNNNEECADLLTIALQIIAKQNVTLLPNYDAYQSLDESDQLFNCERVEGMR